MGSMKRLVQLFAALCVLAAASACTTDDPTATTTIPLVPTQPIVDTLSGTIPLKGTDTKVFSVVLSNGALDITLTALSQPVVVNLGAGTWDGTTCTLGTNATRNVTAGSAPLSFTGVGTGNYCVQLQDLGNLTGPATYTITIAHY